MGDTSARRILPQSSQMQTFSFAPPTNFGPPKENQKNYVFVDEHNRHKRLKVMRACEGCRRRKIKCDAATTNTWPCSACIRLKLHCVPPTINYEQEFATPSQNFQTEHTGYESTGSGDEDYQQHILGQQQHLSTTPRTVAPTYEQHIQYTDPAGLYQSSSYIEPPIPHGQQVMYNSMQTPVNILNQPQQYSQPAVFATPPHQRQNSHPETPENFDHGQDLADLLGDLKMSVSGSAPYLNNKGKNKTLVEEPAFEEPDEYKNVLPPSSGPDLKVRIPPALMPDDDTVLQYFDMYFTNVHPYVPVLNKSLFYQQWHTNRESISPLVLEAIFAIAGRLADEPSQGHQWLALASKHADSFLDVPRLSTLQATLIVLKARESAPKKGYYFRSWMTVVQCVQMAKDLGLDDHFEDHKAGRHCGSDAADCITKTRIWQTIFICELMIGSPQGRFDMAVEMDSLDLSIPRTSMGTDDLEFHVTRNFTYFTRVVRNVRRLNIVYARIRKKKDWGVDPELVQLNTSFELWMNDLPGDLQITFPSDGTPPWLPSHFIGNLHSYYHLSIIMLHRPQLTFMQPSGLDGGWKHHMMVCYSSAKQLCRLQEAILQSFGMTGLLSMQRGINFTIYCILTCTVLHLVALTSPDPDLSGDAREYFTRHMRILEQCTSSWPMPDMQQQIDALREAFSADTRKPFVLKPSFPYGSPQSSSERTPPHTGGTQYRQASSHGSSYSVDHHTLAANQPVSYAQITPISPPRSTGTVDTKSDSPSAQLTMMSQGGQRPQPPAMPTGTMPDSSWNPARIFDQWNTTFGTAPPPPTSTVATPAIQSTSLSKPNSGAQEVPTQNNNVSKVFVPENSNVSQPMPPQQYSGAAIPSFVSPSMWQESVLSVYQGGLKRQWDDDGYSTAAKRR